MTEHDSPYSCASCRYGLGPDCCRLNLEAECAAGEYEMWENGDDRDER